MIRVLMLLLLLTPTGCGDSVKPEKVDAVQPKPFERNAMDTVGVAEGDEQVSPYGKPAR